MIFFSYEIARHRRESRGEQRNGISAGRIQDSFI